MLNIDEIGDYRDLLKNFFVQKKLEFPLFSYKMMGQKLGLETSQVFRVLNKESHLPAQSIPLSKKLLGLKGHDGELFEILVAASRTKSKAKKDKLYKMALALQDVSLRKLNFLYPGLVLLYLWSEPPKPDRFCCVHLEVNNPLSIFFLHLDQVIGSHH